MGFSFPAAPGWKSVLITQSVGESIVFRSRTCLTSAHPRRTWVPCVPREVRRMAGSPLSVSFTR